MRFKLQQANEVTGTSRPNIFLTLILNDYASCTKIYSLYFYARWLLLYFREYTSVSVFLSRIVYFEVMYKIPILRKIKKRRVKVKKKDKNCDVSNHFLLPSHEIFPVSSPGETLSEVFSKIANHSDIGKYFSAMCEFVVQPRQ